MLTAYTLNYVGMADDTDSISEESLEEGEDYEQELYVLCSFYVGFGVSLLSFAFFPSPFSWVSAKD